MQVQRDQRCVWRAVWLMALCAALSAVGVAYGVVLQGNFLYGTAVNVVKVICALGLAALSCLAAFVGLLMIYRRKLNSLREQCRCLAMRFLESRLGRPPIVGLAEVVKSAELIADHQERLVPAESSTLGREILGPAIEQGQNSNQYPRLIL